MKPDFISCIFSAAEKLAEYGADLRSCDVSFLSTKSETSTRNSRDKLEKILNLPVKDEYSSEEVGLMAYKCSQKNIT